jgi:hypothetical protein
MTAAVVSTASMSTTANLCRGWRWKNNDQNHHQYQNQSQSCPFHNSPLSNKMLLQMQRSCGEICSEVVVKVSEKEIQKANGARRNIVG